MAQFALLEDFARTLERELTASLEREKNLRGALEPFANLDIKAADNQKFPDDRPVFGLNSTTITLGHIRQARALLSTQGGPTT